MRVNWLLLVGFVLGCNLVGAIGALWTSGDSDWYRGLNKSSLNPPNWVFGPMWTLLFSLMGIALYLVWVSADSKFRTIALVLFGVQFVLNVLWSYLFFGLQNPFWSLIEIFFLLVAILVSGVYFWVVDSWGGYLMVPYFVWVAFASFLNWSLWRLN